MKYILFIITFFICTIAQSQVKVLGYIAPNAPSDTYPTHLDINGAGGFMAMNTLAERNAIPVLRRKKGMMVYVADSTKTYQLQNDLTTWLPFVSNGGQSILQLASGTVLGGIKISNDFTIGPDSVMSISGLRKNLWNQIALLYQYSTTDSMLSKIDSATTAHDYTFNDTDFIWSGRYVLLRHRYSPQDSLFMASVAYNITQQDIDNWNASIDLSDYYNKSQVDSLIDSGFARHKYWFDGKTIKGEGTFPDPFHVDPFGDTTSITYLNEHTYTIEQVDSAIAANYHIYGAGYGLILDNSTFILDTAALKLAFFINSVANSITQEDIDRWNAAVDFSNFYTKAQIDSALAAQALASRIYFDGVTIQGDGTALDPFHAVFGEGGSANFYTRGQVDSAIAANYHIYGAGYGLLLQNSTFSVDTSVIHGGSGGSTIDTANRFISDVIGVSSNTLRFIKGTGYFDVIIQNGGYTKTQVDSAIAANSGVTTFNGRNGAVAPQLSDYSAYYAALSHTHPISDVTNLQSALDSKTDSVTVKRGVGVDTLMNYYPNNVHLIKGFVPKGKNGLITGGTVTWNTGLTYDVTAAIYNINDLPYASPSGSITLNAADATLDRTDVIALDNTGSIIKITGVPSATPAEPQVDPSSQLYLTSVSIPAGSTQPLGVVSNVIYNENISPEWTVGANGMSADPNNTTAPYTGSKANSTSGWTNGQTITFTASSNWSASTLAALKLYVRLKSVIPQSGAIYVRFFNGGNAVSNSISMSDYGLNKALVGGYQNISMPIADFGITGFFNKIQIRFGGSNSDGVYIDYVQFQSGVGTQTNTNYIADIFKKPGTDSVFKVLNSKTIFIYRDSIGSGGGGGSTDTTSLSRRINRKPTVFNVLDYGAVGDGTTDNTTAFASTMSAVVANGGGVFYVPKGIYIGKIVVPQVATSNWIGLEIRGESPPSFLFGTVGAALLPNTGTIIKSTSTSGSGVISVTGPSFSAVHIHIRNIEVRTYDNPQINGVDVGNAQQALLENVFINTGVYAVSASFPSNGTSGLITPLVDNGALTELTDVTVTGYYNGIVVNEHTDGRSININGCVNGLNFKAANQASNFARVGAYRNTNNIYVTGTHEFNITQLNIENAIAANSNAGNSWQINQYYLKDTANLSKADITYKATHPIGADVFTKSGGVNVQTRKIGDISSLPAWLTTGNVASSSTSFLGTTNNTSLRLITNNVERAVFDSTGKVGIGKIAPSFPLDVSGDVINITNTSTSQSARVSTTNNLGYTGNLVTYPSSFSISDYSNNSAVGATNSLILGSDGGVTTGGNHPIKFRTGGYNTSDAMKISSNGNVSVGTTDSTSAKLIVNGSTLTSGVTGSTANSGTLTLSSTSAGTKGKILLGANGAYDEANNRLGIGTSSPSDPLSVIGSSGSPAVIQATIKNTNASGDTRFNILNSAGGGLSAQVTGGSYGSPNIAAFFSQGTVNNISFITNGDVPSGGTGAVTFLTGGYNATQEKMRIGANGLITYPTTVTAAGTTGNQTINKLTGTVNIAAGGTSITVTNSLVSANSIVFAVIRTNDATALLKNVVPASGSFTINLNAAATAETSIGFIVNN